MVNVLDLFAGAGGLGLGFANAGFFIKTAIEIDEWACQTYSYNHPSTKVVCRDLVQMSNEDIHNYVEGPIDMIIGGPPCQGFSHANIGRRDPKDPRNSLFKEYLRCVKLLLPKVFLIENVPGLLKSKTADNESVINVIVNEINSLGYICDYKILNASSFGVPQNRERLFIIAIKKELHLDPSVLWPVSNGAVLSCWDAISDLPQIIEPTHGKAIKYNSPPKNNYQQRMREGSFMIYNHDPMHHSKRIVERFKMMGIGSRLSDLETIHLPRKRGNPNELSNKQPYDQNNRRQDPNKPCNTIPASFYANFIHPFLHRNFTAREGARIQSFPDTYIFRGKKTLPSKSLLRREGRVDELHLCQYEQIGNAVPPLLAEAIASRLLTLFQSLNIYGSLSNSREEFATKRIEREKVF